MDADEVKESSPGADLWRLIGPADELSGKRCRLIYSSLGGHSDICLFHVKGEFFAMDARCAHSGGPLCDGDIEDADGILRVYCPWHDYDFNIRTGTSQTGLQQQVHHVKVEDGMVYVQHPALLSLQSFSPGRKS
ncbi:Rieske domain-containing protein-like isoform X2 [Brienomyrus brachyistius]|uniref:Rieske domain-containing protein-like isoform X2 n=1 Tax=Brienomyrus brachyistius TaxID=42636 RepID=UPI0020B45213|nr:Rieske domain-containing protein-like isoform X2 [Brienomyrus brachyistius]